MKKILVVAAHPDDEVIGCGGTIARHTSEGDQVHIIFMADGVKSRKTFTTGDIEKRNKASIDSCKILGAQIPQFLSFPDNKMDTVALLDIVQELESSINKIQPSIIYTHHGEDLNVDHRITHKAVLTACRPQPLSFISEIYSFEVLSSTEWVSPNPKNAFVPNRFVDISKFIKLKEKALNAYIEEMRSFPHSRSIETAKFLAKYRGSSMGMKAAESFQTERILIK